jgi:hypothetical protein
MQRSCAHCQAAFEITDEDLAFYKTISPVIAGVRQDIPPPTLCPFCRLQRRLIFRNQIYVYQRPSSKTGKPIFSRFTADVPFPVVENDLWYGSDWDPLTFGRDYDGNATFFEQFEKLRNVVPHRSLSLHQAENADYCNNATGIKNCYLTFNTTDSEDCMYCEICVKAKDCVDCTYSPGCQLCYDCTLCESCYNLQSSESCENCTDSFFLSHCTSCKDCFGCINLSHKQFCAFNVQYTEADYRKFIARFQPESYKSREETRAHCNKVWSTHPRPHASIHNSESVSGNHILDCKNVHQSFFMQDCEDCRYCFWLYDGVRSSYDFSFFGKNAELLYETVQCGINDVRVAFCVDCWDGNSDLFYSWMCHGSKDSFGCVGLQKKRYCILNKQYTKEDYEALMPRIIEHMKKSGEWGELFPMRLSPTPYNHSSAQRYFPLDRQQVEHAGCTWYSRDTEDSKQAIAASSLPDGLPANDDAIVVKSELSGKPFRITSQEIKRYRQFRAPLPRKAYDERMEDRIKLLGGIRLYERTCDKTGAPIMTTYPPGTSFPVWLRDAYIQEFRG